MFDSIVGAQQRAERRLGAGAILSIALHGAAIALALWLPSRARIASDPKGVEVTFFAAPTLEPAPGPIAPPGPAPATEPPVAVQVRPNIEPTPAVPKPKTPVPQKPDPKLEKTTDTKPTPSAPESTATPAKATGQATEKPGTGAQGAGVTGGTGVNGGQNGTTGKGTGVGTMNGVQTQHRYEVLPFGPGMTRPRRLAGRDPAYTRAALTARVQGVVIAQCEITTQGRLQACRVLKSQPHMERAVLDALATHRYTPVMYQGRAQAVRYTFMIKLVLPGD